MRPGAGSGWLKGSVLVRVEEIRAVPRAPYFNDTLAFVLNEKITEILSQGNREVLNTDSSVDVVTFC